MKFRKKPVVIEAIQWKGSMSKDISDLFGIQILDVCVEGYEGYQQLLIKTLEGWHYANVGDWIIKDAKNEFYPIKDDIFRETYELLEAK